MDFAGSLHKSYFSLVTLVKQLQTASTEVFTANAVNILRSQLATLIASRGLGTICQNKLIGQNYVHHPIKCLESGTPAKFGTNWLKRSQINGL